VRDRGPTSRRPAPSPSPGADDVNTAQIPGRPPRQPEARRNRSGSVLQVSRRGLCRRERLAKSLRVDGGYVGARSGRKLQWSNERRGDSQ
jgi:hypothetical protein